MERSVIFTCALLIRESGASDSRQTCVDRTEDLRLDCGVGVVYVEGAAALGDCSESVTCCQDTSHGDDVITARIRDWCDGLARCHVTASTWYPAESRGRTSLAVKYMCKVRAHSTSDMKLSVDQLSVLRVTPTIQNTTFKCYGSYFSQQLCFDDTTIEITDAVYGVSPCNADLTHCCPDPGDCTIPVEEKDPNEHPDYYNEILVKCNNKQTCDDLQAQWVSYISQWCTGVSGNTDYVTLHYMCLSDAERLTTTTPDVTISTTTTTPSTIKPGSATPVTAASTATSAVVSMATDTTADSALDNNDVTLTIVIIAVIVAVVVAVVVAVTVWMICRKRKANSTSQENKTAAAQSAPGMMTSHVSACLDDVDPNHTARPGGGQGPREPPPSQGLNDVTKPATNPYDTCHPLAKPVIAKKPKPNPKAIDKLNIGADLYTEVVEVPPRKNVVLDKSPGEEDVQANNKGSDMTEAGDRASYDLVMQENYEYGTRQAVGGEGEGERHRLDAGGFPHEGRQDSDQDEQTDSDYDLVMTENNAYS